MLRNLDIPITNLDGSAALDEKGQPILVRHAVVNALLTENPQRPTSGADKAKRYQLALRAQGGGKQDFAAEELPLIKDLVGDAYGPLVVGQVYAWADADMKPEKTEKGK